TLNHNEGLNKISFNNLLLHHETKEYKTYSDIVCIYIARISTETQWFSTQTTPPSLDTIWFFGTVSGFLKNTEIGKVEFECDIQYKEIVTEQANTTRNYIENTNRDQIYKIIELSSDEESAPKIIKLSSDDESQTPEIIELSSDEEVVFEENQTAVSRDRTPETAE
ncbi:6611_t:CDS:2, partial [Cetraspora pellucida]